MSKHLSKITALAILVITIATSLFYHLGQPVLNVISWDVYGYYLYLPAIFKYGDTTQFLFALDHLKEYAVSSDLYQITDVDGLKAPIYTGGMAMLYLPFYLVADTIAQIIPSFKADGLSPVYQWAIVMASWVYMGLAIYFTRKILILLKFSEAITAWCLVVVFLGTNYFHYAAFENGMPHTYLYTLYSILIYSTLKWHQQAKWKYIMMGGLSLALLCVARPSEGIALIIPLTYGVYNGLTMLIKINRVLTHFKQLFVLLLCGLTIVSIQILFWRINIGEWVFNGYRGHHFDFSSPHFWDGLFSYRKGWLVYSPLCVLGLAGIPLIWKRDKRWFFPASIFILINMYIVLSWHIWWYASSFGMRALIQSYAVLVIPIAATIETLYKNKWSKGAIIFLVILLTGFNQFQDWQYRNKILLQDEMNKSFYWKSFLKTTENRLLRKYIDTEEEYTGSAQPEMLFSYLAGDTPSGLDTIRPKQYGHTKRLDVLNLITDGADTWISFKAEVAYMGDKFNNYDQARLVMALKNGDKTKKWKGIRIQAMIPENEIREVNFDFKLPGKIVQGDLLECTLWNNGPDTILLRSMSAWIYR
jgi:hypothetical protein